MCVLCYLCSTRSKKTPFEKDKQDKKQKTKKRRSRRRLVRRCRAEVLSGESETFLPDIGFIFSRFCSFPPSTHFLLNPRELPGPWERKTLLFFSPPSLPPPTTTTPPVGREDTHRRWSVCRVWPSSPCPNTFLCDPANVQTFQRQHAPPSSRVTTRLARPCQLQLILLFLFFSVVTLFFFFYLSRRTVVASRSAAVCPQAECVFCVLEAGFW